MVKTKSAKKGIALLFTVGVLSLLSLIGTAVAVNSLLEVKQAYNYSCNVKAKYLSEAGIARAIAELRYGSDGPLNDALDKTSDAWHSGYNATLPLAAGLTGGYAATVTDCASRINLNDSNSNLAQILKNLNSVTGSLLSDADCDNIAANRPYVTKEAIRAVSGITQAKYNAISPYITVYGYVDPSVVNPQNLALQSRSPINVNTASSQVLTAVLNRLEADKVCPTCGGDGAISFIYPVNQFGSAPCTACGGPGNLTISSTEAANLAADIISNGPYSDFSGLYAALQVSQGSTIGANDADVVMANANPNTGFAAGGRNYGWASKLGYIGKYRYPEDPTMGLQVNTTEFSFNSGGYYEISSTAAVTDSAGRTLSRKTITAVVKVFDIYKQTTQAEFEAGPTKTNVETYPEPTGAGVPAATYDGQIMVATVNKSTAGASFKAGFTAGFNANASSGSSAANTNCNVASVADTSNPGELLRDGVLMLNRRGNELSYSASGNISNSVGAVGMWVKPLFNGNDTMIYGDNSQNLSDGWNYAWRGINRFLFQVKGAPSTNPGVIASFLYSGSQTSSPDGGIHILLSMGKDDGEDYKDQIVSKESFMKNWKAGQWYYMTFSYQADPLKEDMPWAREKEDWVDGGKVIWPRWELETGFDALNVFDGTSYFCVGYDPDFQSSTCPQVANAVIDEVRIWPTQQVWWEIENAYSEGGGRYMSGVGSEGTFISTVFTPPASVTWGALTWTEALPNYRLAGYPGGGLSGPWQSGDITVAVDTGSGFGSDFTDPTANNRINVTSSSIRYRATFPQTGIERRDTPVLEDVSVLYLSPVKIFYWQ